MATEKQEFVYELRTLVDALNAVNAEVGAFLLRWPTRALEFQNTARPYVSAEPNDRDGFPESDFHDFATALIGLQTDLARIDSGLLKRVGMLR